MERRSTTLKVCLCGVGGLIAAAGLAQPQEGGLEIHSFLFTSDHGILKDGPNNFASDGTSVFNPRGFLWNGGVGSVANPVSHTRGLNVNVTIGHKAMPAGFGYSLEGYLGQWAFQFISSGHTSGSVISTADTSETALPNYITSRFYGTMMWHTYNIGLGDTTTFGNVLYITWATPLETPTKKRLEWACNAAGWFNNMPPQTEEDVADAIWNTLAGNPPYEPGTPGKSHEEGATWKLLDGNITGQCDEQANLMRRAMNILGITATTTMIRASTNTSVHDQETQFFADDNGDQRIAYLVMDFNMGGGFDWNAFEGVCNTAAHWYAEWPKYKDETALALYRQILFQQYWVFTVNNQKPGTLNPDWQVEQIVPGTGPIPKA